jgi:hypothetical protein
MGTAVICAAALLFLYSARAAAASWHKFSPPGTSECIDNWNGGWNTQQNIAVRGGAADAVWVAGCDYQQQCFDGRCHWAPQLYKWNNTTSQWDPSRGYAAAIAIGVGTDPWVIPWDGSIWNYSGGNGNWYMISGPGTAYATDQFNSFPPSIDINGNTKWFLGGTYSGSTCADFNSIWMVRPCLTEAYPVQQSGAVGAEQVVVDHATGAHWVSAGGGTYVYAFGWSPLPGTTNRAFAVWNGTVFGINSNGYLQTYSASTQSWNQIDQVAPHPIRSLTADVTNGTLYAVGADDDKLYMWY